MFCRDKYGYEEPNAVIELIFTKQLNGAQIRNELIWKSGLDYGLSADGFWAGVYFLQKHHQRNASDVLLRAGRKRLGISTKFLKSTWLLI